MALWSKAKGSGGQPPGRDGDAEIKSGLAACVWRLDTAVETLRSRVDELSADLMLQDLGSSAIGAAEAVLRQVQGDIDWYENRKRVERRNDTVDSSLQTGKAKLEQSLQALQQRTDHLLRLLEEQGARLDQVGRVLGRIAAAAATAGVSVDRVASLRAMAAQAPDLAERALQMALREAEDARQAGDILAGALEVRVETARRWGDLLDSADHESEKRRLLDVVAGIKARSAEGGGADERRQRLEECHGALDACLSQIADLASFRVRSAIAAASSEKLSAFIAHAERCTTKAAGISPKELVSMKDGLEMLHTRKMVSRVIPSAQKRRFVKGWDLYADKILLKRRESTR